MTDPIKTSPGAPGASAPEMTPFLDVGDRVHSRPQETGGWRFRVAADPEAFHLIVSGPAPPRWHALRRTLKRIRPRARVSEKSAHLIRHNVLVVSGCPGK